MRKNKQSKGTKECVVGAVILNRVLHSITLKRNHLGQDLKAAR